MSLRQAATRRCDGEVGTGSTRSSCAIPIRRYSRGRRESPGQESKPVGTAASHGLECAHSLVVSTQPPGSSISRPAKRPLSERCRPRVRIRARRLIAATVRRQRQRGCGQRDVFGERHVPWESGPLEISSNASLDEQPGPSSPLRLPLPGSLTRTRLLVSDPQRSRHLPPRKPRARRPHLPRDMASSSRRLDVQVLVNTDLR